MAKEIGTPLPGDILTRAFQVKGRVRPMLEEFIIPTVLLGDLSQAFGPSIGRGAIAHISIGATVGELFTGRFESIGGTICVIKRIFLQSSTANQNLRFGFRGNAATIVALATTPAKTFTDGRLLAGAPWGAQTPSGVLTTGTQIAALGTQQGQIRMPADGILLENLGWVVGTGDPALLGFFEFQVSIANATVLGFFEWDEYPVP
ncbi:MAG: hypothetical protein BMS9Abin29_2518 [Gemmatimonadota bacterium]|nr:MAG: hypothetical protein BMS9Abin29_2518 [Gemmatimonadota bacterium]